MKYIRGYRIRIYPTREQENAIWNHIGASRWIWNYMLDIQEGNYTKGGKFISRFSMSKMLTPMKKESEHAWLNKVSNKTLQKTCSDLADAYTRFFNGTSKHPKYKSRKKAKASFPVRDDHFKFRDGKAYVEKVGWIKFRSDYIFYENDNKKYSNVRLSNTNGKYFLSFGLECESQAPQLTDETMGIDLGIKELAVVACGDRQLVFQNINKSKEVRNLEHRINHLRRNISRKYEASRRRNGQYTKTNNIVKLENELRRLCARLSGIRDNYIHQITHTLVSMLPKTVVMEDLNVSGLMKNKRLSKSISDQCWAKFIRLMRYKCEWNEIPFVIADRFYPSSKTCSCCGTVKRDLKLRDRTFVCPECGAAIDRDYNAAINLSRYASHE